MRPIYIPDEEYCVDKRNMVMIVAAIVFLVIVISFMGGKALFAFADYDASKFMYKEETEVIEAMDVPANKTSNPKPTPKEEPVAEETKEADDIYIAVPEMGYWDYEGEFHTTSVEAQGSDFDASNFQQAGVVYHDGVRYTWYSENVLPGGGLDELNSNGRDVSAEGYVIDGDGYISVASSDHEIGTVLDTPFGMAKVYDSGCESGTVDIYTSW